MLGWKRLLSFYFFREFKMCPTLIYPKESKQINKLITKWKFWKLSAPRLLSIQYISSEINYV